MQVHRHANAESFLKRAEPWLLQSEVENNLLLSIAGRVAEGAPYGKDPPYFATVEEEGGEIVACAVRTPPYNPLVSRAAPVAQELLFDHLMAEYTSLPGVSALEPDARRFAELWSARTGKLYREGMRQRLFVTRHVETLASRPAGRLRAATEEDIPVLAGWVEGFYADAHLPKFSDASAVARERVSQKNLFVWDKGRPVSMAGFAGRTANGVRIQLVYTPPEHRRQGYATATVADLTGRMLGSGCIYCCLVTDLANPTSNHIYETIGYRPVSDMGEYVFGE